MTFNVFVHVNGDAQNGTTWSLINDPQGVAGLSVRDIADKCPAVYSAEELGDVITFALHIVGADKVVVTKSPTS